MCRVDDSDGGWAFANTKRPRAAKDHHCEECTRTIRKGEMYQRFEGKHYDLDGWITHIMCAHCASATTWLDTACGGWIQSEVLDELAEHWRDETEMRSPVLESLIAGMKAKWHDGSAPIPDVAAVRASIPERARSFA